jgi:hypothetical protein
MNRNLFLQDNFIMFPKIKKLFFLLVVLLSLLSCREEIISPDNFVEGVNQPVQIREFDSYTLLLNASNFTMEFNITIVDYGSGYTSISVKDINSIERFRYFIANDVPYHSDLLDGYVPSNINIRTENFSGKVKIEFRRTL